VKSIHRGPVCPMTGEFANSQQMPCTQMTMMTQKRGSDHRTRVALEPWTPDFRVFHTDYLSGAHPAKSNPGADEACATGCKPGRSPKSRIGGLTRENRGPG
jgi:hypothetical protein